MLLHVIGSRDMQTCVRINRSQSQIIARKNDIEMLLSFISDSGLEEYNAASDISPAEKRLKACQTVTCRLYNILFDEIDVKAIFQYKVKCIQSIRI